MKKILVVAGIALMGTGFVYAQGQQKTRMTRAEAIQKSEMRAQSSANRLQKELNLSQEQKGKVYNIILENYKKNAVNGKAMDQQIRQVLTADQQMKMDQSAKNKMMQIDPASVKRHNDLRSSPMKSE